MTANMLTSISNCNTNLQLLLERDKIRLLIFMEILIGYVVSFILGMGVTDRSNLCVYLLGKLTFNEVCFLMQPRL